MDERLQQLEDAIAALLVCVENGCPHEGAEGGCECDDAGGCIALAGLIQRFRSQHSASAEEQK